MYAHNRGIAYCCGVTEIGDFCADFDHGRLQTLISIINSTGRYVYKISTFTNTPACKKAYEIMCSKLKLVSQTEPKRNPNSGNLVFVCVFTNK